jgi:branched-chain amino acid transport system substrate-binding protein
MRTPRWLLAVGVLAALAGSCKSKRQGITVGLYASMTGPTADFGISTRRGVELALEDLNAHGGLLGQRVRLVAEDTRGDASEATSAVTRLIDQEGAIGILGEVASGLSLSGGRVCPRRHIPMVSPSSTNPAVTQVGDHIFRVCFIDPFQGLVMANFASRTLRFTRVAILKDQGAPYSVGLAEAFRHSFTANGGSIVDEQAYRAGDTHFSAQLNAIMAHNPEAIFVPGYYTEVALIAREARGAGFQGRFLGGDGWSGPSLTTNDDDKLVGDYFSEGFAVDAATTPVARDFVRRYRERYHSDPSGLAALGYDAALVLFDGIRRAGTTDHAALRSALATTRNFVGATGSITLNEHRDAVKAAVILQVQPNGFQYHSTVNP